MPTKRKAAKKIKKKARRTPKRLSHTLYTYVEPANGKYAREFGAKHFGSFSAYIDVLVKADRKNHLSLKWTKKPATKTVKAKAPRKPSVKKAVASTTEASA